MACPVSKKLKAWAFQPSWEEDYGFVLNKDRAVCTFCLENVVCRMSSVKRHFETKYKKTFKDPADKGDPSSVLCPGMGSRPTL